MSSLKRIATAVAIFLAGGAAVLFLDTHGHSDRLTRWLIVAAMALAVWRFIPGGLFDWLYDPLLRRVRDASPPAPPPPAGPLHGPSPQPLSRTRERGTPESPPPMTDPRSHWQTVYQTKPRDSVSWYRPHLETSLRLITQAAPDVSAAILDAGAGHSTLADDLLARGYRHLTLVDLSAAALEQVRARLGAAADGLHWLAADITAAALPQSAYDVWHDRAVFHFLTDAAQRAAYLRQLRHALKPGGHLVLATFGAAGPERCSGLPVQRYDAPAQQRALGEGFTLLESLVEPHHTPGGGVQPFQYGLFRRE